MQAVILAGGKGRRLRPFTVTLPKPLVPIGDMPILEVILRQLKHHGFNDIILAVNHLARLIIAFFENYKSLGLNIKFSYEGDKMLGTAGPLSIIDDLEENFLVMNGDLLTTINYTELYRYHMEHECDITIATYPKKVKIDLGVIECDGTEFKNYIEKPTYSFRVSMGIYIMNKSIVDLIPKRQKYDLPDLVLKAKKHNKKIMCYSGDYYWLDIGRVEDYEIAQKIFAEKKKEFLPDAD